MASSESTARKKVVVIGGVAIDHIWFVEQVPIVGASAMATRYVRAPGGVGLSQAIAAARMDLEVSLTAAITDDQDARRIGDRLSEAGINTSPMREMPGLQSPQTGDFEQPRGDSNATVWRSSVQLNAERVEMHARVIAECDVLMLTFEIPKAVLYRALDIASTAERRPVVIVTPGRPYSIHGGFITDEALRKIDYLIAHFWELQAFAKAPEAHHTPELLSLELVGRGLKALCTLENPAPAIYTSDSIRRISTNVDLKESSVTRDVFGAALASQLAESGQLTDSAITWASEAVNCCTAGYTSEPIPSTPTKEQVNQAMKAQTGSA